MKRTREETTRGAAAAARGRKADRVVAADPIDVAAGAVPMQRVERLVKAASSLSTRFDAPVAVAVPGGGGGLKGFCWPSRPEVVEIYNRFQALPEKNRPRYDVPVARKEINAAAAAAAANLAKPHQDGGVAGVLGAMAENELRVLLRSMDQSVATTSDRIRTLQPQIAGDAEQQLTLEYANKFIADSARSNTKSSLNRENPMDMDKLPDGASAAAAEEEEAKWMKDLVQRITEKPKPYTATPARDRNGVPYYEEGRIEYVNLGGHMIERDAFDFIRDDLGMLPPSREPELPDDDDGYDCYGQLWPWTSLPLNIPPPP